MEKSVYRLPSCPSYDIRRTESWLEDMAAQGLFPDKWNTRTRLIRFRLDEPQTLRYRLTPADGNDVPQKEMLELAQAFGWEYSGQYEGLFVYCSSDPAARELNTDPAVQALSLKHLQKQLRGRFLFAGGYLLFLGMILLPGFGYHMVIYGSLCLISLLTMLTIGFVEQCVSLWRLFQLRKQLLAGIESDSSDWRKSTRLYRIGTIIQYLLLVCLLLGWPGYVARHLGFCEKPLAQYPGTPPFVTLDMLQADADTSVQRIDNSCYEAWSDPLFPACISWLDGGSIQLGNDDVYGGLLEVQYCQTLSPWLAKSIARGYAAANGAPELLEQNGLGVDYAATFTSRHGFPMAVLVEGKTVVCVRMSMDDPNGIFTMENWMAQTAEMMK